MSAPLEVSIVGGGNMGAAFALALVDSSLAARDGVSIVETSAARRQELASKHQFITFAAPSAQALRGAVVILAVKPAEAAAACAAVVPFLKGDQLVVSVMAGVSIAALRTMLNGHPHIARCMPNTPAIVRSGISVFCAPGLSAADAKLVEQVLAACGPTVPVSSEALVDAATALSGTGPAYCFYFMEQILAAGVELGFSAEDAERLSAATLEGAFKLWRASGQSLADLRAAVTSKGGTTAAAMRVLDSRQWSETLRAAVRAARDRAVEMRDETEAKLPSRRG